MRDGWVETTLDGIADVIMGQSPDGKSYNQEGKGLPFMQGSAEFGEHNPVPEKWCSDPKKIAEAGDLLLSVRAPVGDTNFADQRIAVGRGLSIIRANKESLTEFIRLVIQLNVAELIASSGSGMFASITGKNLKEFKVNLPPLPEQKRIVDLISSVDSYIEALQQQLESAKRSRNAVLHALLTADGDDWIKTTLGHEFEICKNGKNYKDGISTEGLPISRIQTIANGKIDLTKVGFGNLFLEDAEGFLLSEGDILFSHINSLPHVGKVAIVQYQHLPLIHGMNLLRMRFTNSNDTNFMFYLMQDKSMRDEIKSRAQIAVNQVSINISSIKTIKIVIPPLRTQKEIASLIGAWDNLIEECENNLNSSRNLRVGLLFELLSGTHEIPASYDKVMGAA